MLWVFGKQSALKLGIAKSVESKSQVSLSMNACLQVLKQLVKCHTKIHLWSLLTLRILFWRLESLICDILCLYCILKFHVLQLYMHHVQWSVAMMHYFSCDFSLWPICAFPTTTNTHTFMLPTFTGLAILWVTENICINALQPSIRVFDACDLLQYCWKQKSKIEDFNCNFLLKNCRNVFSLWNYICLFHSLSLKGKANDPKLFIPTLHINKGFVTLWRCLLH
jgi:hypothetical protein